MKLSTTLFTASFVSVVVAGWNHLDAVAPVDGPADAPARHEVSIDGHAVRIELDHERIPAGQAIHATIAMVDPGPGGMDVKVQLLEQTGSMASRMPSPPREVSSQRVHLGADATTVPITLAGVARGDDADPLDFAGSATQYTLVVTAAGDGAAATGNGNANLALDMFATEIRRHLGGLLVELGGADAIVFTGGIGENSVRIRSSVCHNLDGLGIILDPELNVAARGEMKISQSSSPPKIWIVPTNVELIVARQAKQLLEG